jgi:hypothetical protein
MYQKNNSTTAQLNRPSDLWQNSQMLSDIMAVEPTTFAFTPTTLAAMETTLSSFETEMMSDSEYSLDDDESNGGWEMTTSNPAQANVTVTSTTPARRLPGPKSSIRTEDMTTEEVRRRNRRRERNKAAAARCRQRRVDLTNQLLTETQKLEAESQRLEREIENLRKQRDQLQFVLEAHQPTCCGDVPEVKMENTEQDTAYLQSAAATTAVRPSSLPISGKMVPTSANNAELLPSLNFDLGPTGFTPVVSSSGMSVFLGTGADFVSPTTLVLSPSTLLAP